MKNNETAAVSDKVLLYLKIARIMKLTIAFLLIACLQVSARGWSQDRITLKMNEAEIKKVLFAIEKKTTYRFLFSEESVKGKPRVTVDVVQVPLNEVLDKILANTGVSYKILGTNLVVLKEGVTAEEITAKPARITGKVVAASGEPLVGVSIVVKGTRTGTTTNANGDFAIDAPDDATLVFSTIGYETQEVTIGQQRTLSITLQPSIKVQEQVIVVGYGSQRKVDVTGSVAQVRGEEISKQPTPNAISGLQGKVAGVQITNSGAPGSSPQIRIRGLGTAFGSSNPLYVVDGVWFDDVSFLNPADIENINILKDASSEAIYGVRAANGVVLITTKKGRGKTQINYNGFVGMQRVTNKVEMANASEYATMVNELTIANGGNPSNPPIDDVNAFGTGTNWFDVVLRNALITNHHVSLAGGTERSTFNFSLGYLRQEGIIEENDYTRVTARLQNDFNVFKNFKVGYSAVLEGSKSHDAPGGVIYKAFTAAPVVPVFYEDGSYGDPTDYPIGNVTNNPKVQIDFNNGVSKNYRVTGNVYAELKFAKYFTFRSSIGGEFGESDVRNYNPVYAANTIQFNNISKLSVAQSEVRNWILENTLTYDRTFGDHKFKLLLGQGAQRYKSYVLRGTADNVPYSSEGDLYLALGPNTVSNPRTVTDEGALSTYASYFARLNYSFLNRYLVTLSMRADGSSKFVGDERWGYFPSVGAGWIITDESFMKNQKIFDNLKLRGSWGKVGNASVPANLATLTINQSAAFTAIYNGQPYPGASITTIVPPIIYWEKGVGTDIGLEGTVLDQRLNFEIDWYKRETERAIFDIPVVGSLGLSSSTIRANQATFENTGIEISLGWKDNINKDFTYSINGNISFNDNEVTDVTTGNNPIYAGGYGATGGQITTRTVRGQPIGQFYGLQVAGIFQNTAEVAGSAQPSAKPGDFRYVDQNKDGVINGNDRIILGNPNPRVSYGLNTNFGYKNFDLAVDLQGVGGVEIYNANKGLRYGYENFTKDFYDNRWHGQGTSNSYPSVNVGGSTNYIPNSWYVEDGSYLRIRNIQLGYTLNSSLISKWNIQRVRFYVNAQNAFNFFKYKGFTPEVNNGSPIESGIDNGIYPLSATYNFGVNVTF